MRRGLLGRRREPAQRRAGVPARAGTAPAAGPRGYLTKMLGAAAIAGIVGGAAGSATAARDPADREDGRLVVARSALSPGERVEVAGRHAEPGAIVTIHVADPRGALVTTMAGPDGRYSASIEIPRSAGTGWHPVTAVSGGTTLASSEIRVVGPSERAAGGALRALPGTVLSAGLLGLSVALAAALRRYRRQPVS